MASHFPQHQPDELPASALSDRTVIAQAPIAGPSEFFANGTVASLARVLIGQSLDHYRLHDLIGGGGMGAVFRASDTRLDREVAVKVIPNLGQDQESLRRFRIEAQSAAKLDHPNIARVYHVGETEAWNYIVFEYVEGINLRDLVVREGVVTIDDAVYFTMQVAEALQHASERSVVHRDIKPSNVLVTHDGLIKVVDMGLARTTALEQADNDLTASGVTLGTFDYISPEQASDPRAADVRSDLYSLGCTLYFILTGRPPFPEGTVFQKLLMHGSAQPVDPSEFREDISPDFVAILRKLMAKRPEDRYQTPADLIIDLRCLADLEMLPRSQQLSGGRVAAVYSPISFIETWLPWLVAMLLLVVSTWFLYAQHARTDRFEIPREVEWTPVPDVKVSTSEANLDGVVGQTPLDSIGSPSYGKAADSLVSSLDDASVIAKDGGASPTLSRLGLDSPTTFEVNAESARVLWVRPFASNEKRVMPLDGEDYTLATGTLADALEQAERNPQIEEIWLDDDVWSVDVPLRIDRPALVIRSAPGRRARIECRLERNQSELSSLPSAVEMIRVFIVGENQLILDDLELVAFPPNTGHGDYRLIELAAGGSVRLIDSTIGLMPSNAAWRTYGFGQQFDQYAAYTASNRRDEIDRAIDPIEIVLEDCIFRGEGDFAVIAPARRTEITWNNGLLAVTGRCLDLMGSVDDSRSPPNVRINLRDVTVAAREGFARVKLTREAIGALRLTRTADNCVFWEDVSSSHITFENFPSLELDAFTDELSSWLDLRGEDNAYDAAIATLVRVVHEDGKTRNYEFGDDNLTYFREKATEANVRWVNQVPPVAPFEQQSIGDYLQRDGSYRPGFRPEQMPNH